MKKAAGMFAALMITLAMSGVAYAHWSETLWLDVEVETGELALEWSCEIDHDGYKEDYGPVALVDWDFVDDDGDGYNDGLWITVYNAYPCLEVWGVIDIHNVGTIPARFYDIEYCDYYMVPEEWVCDGIEFEYYFEGNCEQIDPCENIELFFWIHFTQDAPELAYAWFHIELEFANWNAP